MSNGDNQANRGNGKYDALTALNAARQDKSIREAEQGRGTKEGDKLAYQTVLEWVQNKISDTEEYNRVLTKSLDSDEGTEQLRNIIYQLLQNYEPHLPQKVVERYKSRIFDDMTGLGILTQYIEDPDIEEINIYGPGPRQIEIVSGSKGILRLDEGFSDVDAVINIIKKMVRQGNMTIDASNRYGIAAATLTKYYNTCQHGQDVNDPLHTIVAKDREGVTLASLVKMKGTNLGGPATEPVQTITAGGGHHGVVTTEVAAATPGADLRNWPKIRAALNEYCGYRLEDNEVILFLIGGAWYFMADIGLRMLTPRELYRANGFPDDYKIERDYLGNVYGKSKQVARCGNAVPPPFATALVRANLPEWCGGEIRTMADFEKAVAV